MALCLHVAVHILHVVEQDHWVATSCRGGIVRLYDSVFSDSLTPSLQKQMAEIYRPMVKDGMIQVTAVAVQQQVENTDSGVYSITPACYDALRKNLSEVTYNTNDMRVHLEHCFEKEELTPFPRAIIPVRRCSEKHLFIKVYCMCGLPESYDSHMIECEECQKWFHFKCMNITADPGNWIRPNCVPACS